MSEPVFGTAQTLLAAHAVSDGLRPLDALQLASALEEHATKPIDSFLTTDLVLAKVALAQGLNVKP